MYTVWRWFFSWQWLYCSGVLIYWHVSGMTHPQCGHSVWALWDGTKQLTKPLKPNLNQTDIKPNLNKTDNNANIILYCALITLMQTRQTRQTVNQRMLITISHLCVVARAWTDMVAMLVTKCDSINWQVNIGRSASGWKTLKKNQ